MPDSANETIQTEHKLSGVPPENEGQPTGQIEAIVHKGLDIAEAGIGLGVNVVSQLGLMIKNQLIDKINGTEIVSATMNNSTSQGYSPEKQTQGSNDSVESGAAEEYYLINRLALHPGDSVSISFSMNNDSLTNEKTISLSLTDFSGAEHHFGMTRNNFSVTPESKTIAPVDFEKFVLTGIIPVEAPADTYYGSIIVEEQTQHRIPVVLVVAHSENKPKMERK